MPTKYAYCYTKRIYGLKNEFFFFTKFIDVINVYKLIDLFGKTIN